MLVQARGGGAAAANRRTAVSSVAPIFPISALPASLRCLVRTRPGHHGIGNQRSSPRQPHGWVSILMRVFRTGTNTLALPQPDPDVLRRARRGDERAFAIIVRQYNGPVFNYVTRVLSGDRALAEDICQEVFMRVYQALPGFDGRCQFTTWLFQVAKHRVVDELRARERRGRPALELEAAPQLHLAVAPPDADDGMDAVWQAIGGLSVDLKMA